MKEYEVIIEDITPCGGEKHAKKSFMEVCIEDPEAYIEETGRYPILDCSPNMQGDIVITTGDGLGTIVRYTFSE